MLQKAVIQRTVSIVCGEVCGPAPAIHHTYRGNAWQDAPTAGGVEVADKQVGRAGQRARGCTVAAGKRSAVTA